MFQDKVSYGFEELDNLPGELDLHFFFHRSFLSKRLRRLSFESFDFEDHLWRDGSLLVEHGIGEGGFSKGADFSWDAEGDLVKGLDGRVVEKRFVSACEFEVMGDVL